ARGTDDGGEARKEIVRHLARRAVDEARADLRQLAADISLDLVAQHRRAAVVAQIDCGAALGEAGCAAAAFARNLVAVRRIEIAERHLAAKARADRPDLRANLAVEFGVGNALERFAAGNALLHDRRVVERAPNLVARCGDPILTGHVHGTILINR